LSQPRRGDPFAALKYRPFAIFWTGALISNCGVWMQNVSVPYVIYRSTGSPALVGFTGFSQFIPTVFLGPIGGWLAGRCSRRNILVLTQGIQGIIATAMWLLYAGGVRNAWVLIALVFATGIVQGLNVPAWQAFVVDLVPRRALLNAVTLNSGQFNAARAIGPSLAGAVLAGLGVAWVFLMNAASYGAVVLALVAIPSSVSRAQSEGFQHRVLPHLIESVRFVRAHRGILVCVSLVAVGAGLGQPVFQLLPVFADRVFSVEAWRFGLMAASIGLGGAVGTVLLGLFGQGRRRSVIVRVALASYAVALLVFASSPTYAMAVAALIVAGTFYIAVQASLNTSVQMQVTEALRGGVLAVYVIIFNIAYPLGSLMQGLLVDVIGPRWTVIGCASAILVAWCVASLRGAFAPIDAELDSPDLLLTEV
jgi:predicted MFS family arabinose efflux permease